MTPRLKLKRCPGCGREFRPRSVHQALCRSCLVPQVCSCSRPIRWIDDVGIRCLRCSKWLTLPKPVQLELGDYEEIPEPDEEVLADG